MYGAGREAQVPAILDAYNIPYTFSDPLVLSLALNKSLTKRVVRDVGVPTPDFIVVESTDYLNHLSQMPIAPPLFAKPVSEGTGKGIDVLSKIIDLKELKFISQKLLKNSNNLFLLRNIFQEENLQ